MKRFRTITSPKRSGWGHITSFDPRQAITLGRRRLDSDDDSLDAPRRIVGVPASTRSQTTTMTTSTTLSPPPTPSLRPPLPPAARGQRSSSPKRSSPAPPPNVPPSSRSPSPPRSSPRWRPSAGASRRKLKKMKKRADRAGAGLVGSSRSRSSTRTGRAQTVMRMQGGVLVGVCLAMSACRTAQRGEKEEEEEGKGGGGEKKGTGACLMFCSSTKIRLRRRG